MLRNGRAPLDSTVAEYWARIAKPHLVLKRVRAKLEPAQEFCSNSLSANRQNPGVPSLDSTLALPGAWTLLQKTSNELSQHRANIVQSRFPKCVALQHSSWFGHAGLPEASQNRCDIDTNLQKKSQLPLAVGTHQCHHDMVHSSSFGDWRRATEVCFFDKSLIVPSQSPREGRPPRRSSGIWHSGPC